MPSNSTIPLAQSHGGGEGGGGKGGGGEGGGGSGGGGDGGGGDGGGAMKPSMPKTGVMTGRAPRWAGPTARAAKAKRRRTISAFQARHIGIIRRQVSLSAAGAAAGGAAGGTSSARCPCACACCA